MSRGLSQDALGRKLGLTFQQVQKYERGANRISAGRLFEVSIILEVEVVYFFEGLHRPSMSKSALKPAVEISTIRNSRIRRQILSLIRALVADEQKRDNTLNAERRGNKSL